MDLSDTIQPTSDQLDAVDLLAGERTFTIDGVTKGNAEQPVNFKLKEFPRVWRPGKSMRRVLVALWGPDSSKYVGHRVTLYCDPTVTFGGAEVGGTRIRAMSHIDRAQTVPLLVARGRSAPYRVQPITEAAQMTPEATLALRVDEAITSFAHGKVAREQLEAKVGKPADDWTAQDVDTLQALFEQLRKREITKAQAFPPADQAGEDPSADPDELDLEPKEGGW